jgi:hypothetical protein
MRSPTFDEVFAMLLAVQLSADAVARLREWIASIAHPAECFALIEQAAAIVEADETYRLESQKGSRKLTRRPRKRGGVAKRRGISREHDCLLVARDRNGQTLDFHTGRGQVTVAQLHACLTPVLQAGLMHEAVNVQAGERTRGAIHIQNVNSWHSRFKNWLVRFRGVASRYLINYSGWQRVLVDRRLTTPAQLLRAAVQFDYAAGLPN